MSVPWYLMAKGKGGSSYKTASGPIVSVNDALAAPLRSLVANIEPVQDLHGYENPWPAGGGKNKFNYENVPYGGSAVVNNGDGTLTIAVGGGSTGVATAGKKTLAQLVPDLVVGKRYYLNATTTGTEKYIYASTRWNFGSAMVMTQTILDSVVYFYSSGLNSSATISNIIICKDSETDKSFAPYSNICPISGWSAVNVWRTGKNLFNINAGTSYIYSDVSIQNNRIVISSIGSGATSRVYFTQTYKPGTYTLSTKMSGQLENTRIFSPQPFAGGTYNAYYGGYYAELTNGQRTVTMTEPFTIGVIAQGTAGGQGEVYDIQLELGSPATPYEPYSGNQYTIQLGDTYYGGTLDVTHGVLTVDRAMVVFDGSQDEEWHDYSNYNGYYIQLTAMKSGNRQDGWSNMLKDSKTSAQGQIGAMWLGVNNSRNVFVIGVHDTMGETLSAFRSYLFEHPLELVYPLATPITIPLTSTQISTLKGENSLWADSGDVTAEYLASGGTDPNLMKLSVAFMGRR